ncbi:hypothetical protein GGS21DRAFT_515194 [Xylaria nigripes]|nr:hypothetical protein GGS21DRAFT_515194 [Xylaria nigripes]
MAGQSHWSTGHRSRHSRRQSQLPIYEKSEPRTPSRERFNNGFCDESEYDEYSTSSSPSSAGVPILSKRRPTAPRRPARPRLYRLPNRVIRCLCFGLASFIVVLILTLVRASYNENRTHFSQAARFEEVEPLPHTWEFYHILTRYYGGIRTLVPLAKSSPEYPPAKDEAPLEKLDVVRDVTPSESARLQSREVMSSKEFSAHPLSIFQNKPDSLIECYLDAEKRLQVPPIRYYDGRPAGFPKPALGSYELLNLSEDICLDRHGRYGPYGFGYSVKSGGLGIGEQHGDKEGYESTWEKVPQVDWKSVHWANIQRQCYQANAARYKPLPERQPSPLGFYIGDGHARTSLNARDTTPGDAPQLSEASETGKRSGSAEDEGPKEAKGNVLPRTAVVVRCWDEYLWREEDVLNFRALISELALASGGRYDIHLLVQVKNDARFPIWADSETYQRRIEESIPAEFRGLVTLWTETQMLSLYQGIHDIWARGPTLPVHGVYRGLQMALQYFAYQHPEYDYFWQWEMDIRYIGHYFDLVSKIERWAREQPRKGLWERNSRFYLPSVHGSWENFKLMTQEQIANGFNDDGNVEDGAASVGKDTDSSRAEKPIWGPERPMDSKDWYDPDLDPTPPTTYEKDNYEWGVDEEADYIVFNPLFDPERTTWGLANDITGYNEGENHEKPPRRAQIVTASRMSRRLLLTMHKETAFLKHHAFPEMWPGTVALQHGFKAVFVPHPVYVERQWPTETFAKTLNNGKNGASGGSRYSVFGDREHNLEGLTWFYRSTFSEKLYGRWLGLSVDDVGGEQFELVVNESKSGKTVEDLRGGEGRMCVPPMLIHPVKGVDFPVDETPADVEIPESDTGL